MKKIFALLLAATLLVATACSNGGSPAPAPDTSQSNSAGQNAGNDPGGTPLDGPYSSFDLSEHVTIVKYVLGDRPQDMDRVLEIVNSEFLQPSLNATLVVHHLPWSDWDTRYSLTLLGDEQVDLMYTAAWAFYAEEAAKGAFKELTMDWIREWMPFTYESQNPASWDQISLDSVIYAVPRNYAGLENKQMIGVREDLRATHNLPEINSWDTMRQYLFGISANEPAIFGYAAAGNAGNLFGLYFQNIGLQELGAGSNFFWNAGNDNSTPSPEDVFFLYSSDYFMDYALEMANFAMNDVWSRNAINSASDVQEMFVQGRSASIIWNVGTVTNYGNQLEEAGAGTYALYDVSPNMNFRRSSYAGDAIAIAAKSQNPERAGLVLDYLKNDSELNLLFTGGIEGEHFVLQNGLRSDGPAADRYPWDNSAWALRTAYLPKSADTGQRQLDFEAALEGNIFETPIDGFSFDIAPVQAEVALITAITNEYGHSFQLGVFEADTQSALDEFRERLFATNALEVITAELTRQYTAFCTARGITF